MTSRMFWFVFVVLSVINFIVVVIVRDELFTQEYLADAWEEFSTLALGISLIVIAAFVLTRGGLLDETGEKTFTRQSRFYEKNEK